MTTEMRRDIQCAADSTAGVLITGPDGAAESIALEIHQSAGPQSRPFRVVDCQNEHQLAGILECAEVADGETLLLRQVEMLSPELQASLSMELKYQRRKIVASTTVHIQEPFNQALFYQLNVVHIFAS